MGHNGARRMGNYCYMQQNGWTTELTLKEAWHKKNINTKIPFI